MVFTFHNTWNHFLLTEKRDGSCNALSVNKGCQSHQRLQPPWTVSWSAWENSRRKEDLPCSSHSPESPEETQAVNTGHWPQTGEVWNIHMSSVSPDSCIFRNTESHYIPWLRVIWFSLVYNNRVMFRPPAHRCKTSMWPGSLPLPPGSSSQRATWDSVFWAWNSKNFHWIT